MTIKKKQGLHVQESPDQPRISAKKKGKADNRLEFMYYKDGPTHYYIPKAKKWVRSTFDSLYLTDGGMLIHICETCESRTLYALEPAFKGHNPKNFSLRFHIPYNGYQLTQPCLKNMDILFVLYRKDLPEPIWIGKPELSGSLTAQLPYMEYSYGEYFLLIANLTPAPHLQQQFKRMDFCWRVDFEFLPNGIHLEHPEIESAKIQSNTLMTLFFKDYVSSNIHRFTVQFFDREYHFMGASEDIRPIGNQLSLKLPQKYLWTDGDYHAILQHNLYGYKYLKLSLHDGQLAVKELCHLSEDSPFYRLSIDITCNETNCKRWKTLYGCSEVKEKLLHFISTHELDDYQHFCITAPEGFKPSLAVLANLLYEPQFYMECNVSHLMDRFGTASLKTLFNYYERDSGPIVLGLMNVGHLSTDSGMGFVKELESFIAQPHHSLVVCGTREELEHLFGLLPALSDAIPDANRCEVLIPTIEEYMRMSEVMFHQELLTMNDDAKHCLRDQFYLWRDKIVGLSPVRMCHILEEKVIKPFRMRTAESEVKNILGCEDIQLLSAFWEVCK